MIRGSIIKNRPLMGLTVAWKERSQNLVVLVDTGFTGELKLSEETAQELGLQITHTQQVQLGDGKDVSMASSLALVDLEGVSTVVSVLVSPGDTMVGVGLFKKFQYVMHLDFKFNTLLLERSASIVKSSL